MKDKKVAIYVRVSTKDQSTDMQLNDLEMYSRDIERKINDTEAEIILYCGGGFLAQYILRNSRQ